MSDEEYDEMEEEQEDEEDVEEEQDAPASVSNDKAVWIEFRLKGSRGPKTSRGRHGRIVLEGNVNMGVVAYLQRLEIGPEAGLCEPLSIWISSDHQTWTQVHSTVVTPAQQKEQIDRAQVEYEREMQALSDRVTNTRTEQAKAAARLEFVQQQIQLAEASLKRYEQEIELLRSSVEAERKRADDEREQIKLERRLRMEERQALIQMDLEERRVRQDQANKQIADLNNIVSTSAAQVQTAVGALNATLTEEMTQSRNILQQEKVLQTLVQQQKLTAVGAAGELKEHMDQMPKPKEAAHSVHPLEYVKEAIAQAVPIVQLFVKPPA